MDNLFKYKTHYRFDSLDKLTFQLDDDTRIYLIDSDSGLFISCSVFVSPWDILRL